MQVQNSCKIEESSTGDDDLRTVFDDIRFCSVFCSIKGAINYHPVTYLCDFCRLMCYLSGYFWHIYVLQKMICSHSHTFVDSKLGSKKHQELVLKFSVGKVNASLSSECFPKNKWKPWSIREEFHLKPVLSVCVNHARNMYAPHPCQLKQKKNWILLISQSDPRHPKQFTDPLKSSRKLSCLYE